MSGTFGATFTSTSLLASKIPVLRPWLQNEKKSSEYIISKRRPTKNKKDTEINLENCPMIAGMEPLYKPLTPICGSLARISGKVSVEA